MVNLPNQKAHKLHVDVSHVFRGVMQKPGLRGEKSLNVIVDFAFRRTYLTDGIVTNMATPAIPQQTIGRCCMIEVEGYETCRQCETQSSLVRKILGQTRI